MENLRVYKLIKPTRELVEQFCSFCREFWLPAGIIGIPTFLISLFISLAREKKKEPYE